VSAKCCTRSGHAVKRQRSILPSITVRVTPDEKQRFATLAVSRGVSEARLASIALRSLLESNIAGAPTSTNTREPAVDRITIRLRPGDRKAIGERAARRGLKDSTYLAGLVRAHVSADPPLASAELVALKQSVAVLAGIGRLLARMARTPAPDNGTVELQESIDRTRRAVAAVEQRVHDLAQAALEAWETRYE
jgi:hypothetical protein